MDIKCRKTSCKHNDSSVCNAQSIKVSEGMQCKTFAKSRTSKHTDTSKNMFEIAPEVAPFRHNKTIGIACEAKCLFNKGGECFANGIIVNEIRECPLCITYIQK